MSAYLILGAVLDSGNSPEKEKTLILWCYHGVEVQHEGQKKRELYVTGWRQKMTIKKKKKKENDNKWVNQKSEGNFQRLTDTVKKIGL